MQKDIEIIWNGENKVVRMKRLTFGERNQLTEEAVDIKIVNGQAIAKVSQKNLIELGLLKSIVDAPFTIDLKTIQNLDQEIGDLLTNEFSELNQQSPKKKD